LWLIAAGIRNPPLARLNRPGQRQGTYSVGKASLDSVDIDRHRQGDLAVEVPITPLAASPVRGASASRGTL